MKTEALYNQVIIITGASAGIGKSLAFRLSAKKAKIVLAARRLDRLEEIAEQCRGMGAETLVVQTDVSDEDQCRQLIQRTIEKFGRIDMLINNAGMNATALLEDLPDLHLFHQVVNTNFFGTVYCTYYALPYLKESHGRIVAISSLGGKAALPYNSPYISSKFAIHGFCDTLRMELKKHGISVTVVCPSWVMSEFHEAQMNKDGIPKGESGRLVYTKKTMTSDRCAEIVLNAAFKKKREVLMGPGKVVGWLKLISPSLLDWITINLFLGSVVKRVNSQNRTADK
jgi:short-subunit dehydrogenase